MPLGYYIYVQYKVIYLYHVYMIDIKDKIIRT